ncbi:hypothetical protein AKJ16_DCAP17792 [Drosera capensis]
MSLRTTLDHLRMRGLFQLLHLRSDRGSVPAQPMTRSMVVGFPRSREPAGLGLRLMSTGVVGNGSGKIDGESTSSSSSSSSSSPAGSPARPPRAPKPGFPRWARWLLGSVFSLVLSFWMPKWGTLLRIGGEAEIVMQEVEKVAEAVEKVATMAEKVSADIAQQLPDDDKFKAAALIAEHVSEETANDAHIVEQIIHKVDEVKQDVEDIGKMAEPGESAAYYDEKRKKEGAGGERTLLSALADLFALVLVYSDLARRRYEINQRLKWLI